MTAETKNIACKFCGIQLVETDAKGKLQFGKHLKDCPALLIPETEGPARRVAKSRLICGDLCIAPQSDYTDLGSGLVHCIKCKSAGLAKDAATTQLKKKGDKKPLVEIIHPAPRKTIQHWKRLYLDLLQKHAFALDEIERLKKSQH